MRKLGRLFSYAAETCWSFLPWSFNLYFAKALAFLWIDILGLRKDVIESNLKLAFPQMPAPERRRIGKKSMVGLCRSFFDVIRIPRLTDEWINDNVIFEGQAQINEIRQNNSGIFFLSLHLGSGDLAGAIISRRIKPLTLISKRFSNRFLDSFWFALRGKSETLFVDAHAKNNAFDILGALKNQRGVVFVLDQFMGRPYGLPTRFFGVETGTAYGLALFAKKTRKPVYPLYTYWDDNSKLHICIDEAIDLSNELSENNDVITNKFNMVLENIISRHPEHWMWVHKRWKTYE